MAQIAHPGPLLRDVVPEGRDAQLAQMWLTSIDQRPTSGHLKIKKIKLKLTELFRKNSIWKISFQPENIISQVKKKLLLKD